MIYLDNAATTYPKPPSVARAMTKCIKEYCGNPGRSSHPLALRSAEAVFDTRSEICAFFGTGKQENVIFCYNATHAINKVLSGLVRPGDGVITTNIEHNSVRRPVAALCALRGASYDMVNALLPEEELIAEIESKITSRTRIVAALHASNVCSVVLPVRRIGELCKKHGLIYVLDASQSAGIYDINIPRDGVTVLCAPGHKGLFGPQGTGFAVFCDDFDFSLLSPSEFGGSGFASADITMGHTAPESYEAGTVNVPGIVGLGEGIRYVRSLGIDRILSHEKAMFSLAKKGLSDIDGVKIYLPDREGGVLLFNFEGMSGSALSAQLADEGICTRPGLHCAPTAHEVLDTGGDAVRISFSAFTSPEDIYSFCSATKRLCRR